MSRPRCLIASLWLAAAGLAAAPTKPIVADNPDAAAANRAALVEATERTSLPRGVVSVDAVPVLTGKNSGLVLTGHGSTLKSTQALGGYIERASLAIRCGLDGKGAISWRGDETPDKRVALTAGQIGWGFKGGDASTDPGTIRRFLPGQALPTEGEFVRAFKGVPFTTGKVEFVVAAGHGLAVGDDVFATDGPLINELVGEFRRIVAATAQTVTLDQPLRRVYSAGTFIKGPFPARMSFSGVTFAGQLGSVFLQQAVEIQFADCTVLPVPGANMLDVVGIAGCGRIEFRRCKLTGVGISSGCGAKFSDCEIGHFKGEQGQIDVQLERCRVGWLDSAIRCTNWTLTDCDFDTYFGVYDLWTATNCRCAGTVYARGRGCRIQGLKTNGPVVCQSDYSGAPAGSGQDMVLSGIEAPVIELWPGTSGKIFNSTAIVVCRDAATKLRWTRDGRPIP